VGRGIISVRTWHGAIVKQLKGYCDERDERCKSPVAKHEIHSTKRRQSKTPMLTTAPPQEGAGNFCAAAALHIARVTSMLRRVFPGARVVLQWRRRPRLLHEQLGLPGTGAEAWFLLA